MKICVYAICKNESKFVKQWLDNMSEADYIVVMDTGSTDGTYKMLKEDSRVTRVEKKIIKPWRFDVARNESMKLIPDDADVLVCTDFDELFEPGWADVIRQRWKENTTRMFYTYAWSHNEKGEPQDVFKYDKIHNRDYHWIFPVHEVVFPIDENKHQYIEDVGTDIYLHHYPDKDKQRGYYFDLLKQSIEENPEDSHVRMLYARELVVRDEIDNAIEEFKAVIDMPDVNEPGKKEVLLNSILQLAFLYSIKDDVEETLWYCEEFIKIDPTYREPYLLMAETYNKVGIYTLAESCVEAAKKYTYQHYSWVERARTYTNWLEDVESICQFNLGRYQEAVRLGNEALAHEPDDERLIKNQYLYLSKYCEQLENKLSEYENQQQEIIPIIE